MTPTRRHVIADLEQVDAAVLDDLARLRATIASACVAGGATVLEVVWHQFDPQGVTVVALLAESHAAIHTWPEAGVAFLDVFTCGEVDPGPIVDAIVDSLDAQVTRRARL